MAAENRPTGAGATSVPPSNQEYSSQGVFSGGTGTGSGFAGQGTTGQTDISGGTGEAPNDSTITLVAGTGLDGTGSFTTNQATDGQITFNLTNTGIVATSYGTADNPVQSITVDAQGRISAITTQTVAPIPTPFNDQFRSSDDNRPLPASEMATTEMVTLNVGTGYTLSDIVVNGNSGAVPVTNTEPVISMDGTEATFEVTIPANDEATDPLGNARVTTSSTVTENETMRTRTETSVPLNREVFIPYYLTPTTTSVRGAPGTLDMFTASDAPLSTAGTPVSFSHPGPDGRQYAYLALESVPGRTYRFDAGFFDLTTDPTGTTYERFGRTFDLYEFPTNGDLSFTIRF